MPGETLHFVIARRALLDWRSPQRASAPFDPYDPVSVGAVLHGSVGPDLGYFPGGHRVLSDLADQAVHPWIGRGVGELQTGRCDHFVDGGSDFPAHLRVEMGADAWFGERHAEVRRCRLIPLFRRDGIGFLVRA